MPKKPVKTQATLNERISDLMNKIGNGADRRAELDRVLTEHGFPIIWPPDTYLTEWYVLPGGKLRAISVSGEVMKENAALEDVKAHLPAINLFEIPPGGLEYARLIRVECSEWRDADAMRHVEILGPSTVFHDPTHPVADLPRRSAVMVTDAPLRVWIDTPEQERLYGYEKRPFGC